MEKKYRYLFYIILLIVNTVAVAAGIFFFWSGKDFSQNQKKDSLLFGASYMTMNNEFYKIISEEITYRVEAEGDRMVLRDPALDVDRQIEQIQEMLDMGIDVLIITPVDWERLTLVLMQARKQGTIIVVLDTNVESSDLADCTITSDNYEAGALVGRYFLTQHEKSRILVMTHEATKSGQDRVEGFIDTVMTNENMEIVMKIECEGQLEIAMPKMRQAIEDGIEFDSVFCLNDLASVGVAAALDEKDMLNAVDLYGVDASPDSKALIAEGMMRASAAQFPTEIGKEAADVIYRLIKGEQVEKDILVPVELITEENVEQFGIDRWQ
ncbi:MAG: sugar ABC transporter substrate-binding protein [Lachnospiraceae bacterium]|nr:sugar ABC transporter substrate-binding protein [Lachnospiraceae bacterium]MDE6185504.1 sugar ABC transporter substrate-binding protein [Lachnospiraceae bacterium]